jgi:hypothetical protein
MVTEDWLLSSIYDDEPYESTLFCNSNNAGGHCGEQPDLLSARTVSSVQSADQYRSWYEIQRVLQAGTNALAAAMILTTAFSSSSLPSLSSSSSSPDDDDVDDE